LRYPGMVSKLAISTATLCKNLMNVLCFSAHSLKCVERIL
jgi:hypothetical protein